APRRALGISFGEAAVRPRPDADVILIAPVDQIVATCCARSRVIGNLVCRQASGFESRLGQLEHARRFLLARQLEGAALVLGEEACAALDGELVERQMLARQRQRLLELGEPAFGLWPGRA